MAYQIYSRQIQSLIIKILSVLIGTCLQILMFRNLNSEVFAFVVALSIVAAVIGQIDFGLIGNVSIQLLHRSKEENFELVSKSFIKDTLIEFKGKLFSLFVIWMFFSSVAVAVLLVKIENTELNNLVLACLSVLVILFHGFSSLILRMLLTLGQSHKVLVTQLVSLVLQFGLFLNFPSVFTAVSTLIISPLIFILIALWSEKFEYSEKFPDKTPFKELQGVNWALQFSQILGVLITLLVPYLSIFMLSSDQAAIFQLQYKIAMVLIGVVGSTYINALRFSILFSWIQIKKLIISSTIISIVITSAAAFLLENYWELIFQNNDPPKLHSWIGLTIFVTIQPFTQVFFFIVMGQQKYKTLIQSVMIQGTLLISSMILLIKLEPSFLMYSLPFSTLISSVPILTSAIKQKN